MGGGPDAAPALGVVLCPGRLGGVEGLRWLAEPLAAAGAELAAVEYPDGGRYLVDDAARARATAAELRERLPAGVPVAIAGHSRGATVALLAAALDPGFGAVVALSPTTDQERLVRGLAAFAPTRYREMVAARGATPDEDPAYYRATSPLSHAARLRAPLLVVHGSSDLVVPHDHSLWLHAALREAGNAGAELVLVEAAGHFFERMYGGYVFGEVVDAVLGWLRRRALLP